MDVLKSVSAAGTAAVFTVTVIHPIDVVKTRLQISGEGTRNYKSLGSLGTIKVIASEEGIPAFWKGIGAAWLREASYTSLRLGLYGPIKKAMGVTNESSFFLKFTAGSLAGAIGSVVGNPFDVLKTQMMATEGTTKPSLVNSASKVYSTQGIAGFYRGMEANIMRAMVLNGTKMACYDTVKGKFNFLFSILYFHFSCFYSYSLFQKFIIDLIKKSGVLPKGLATDFFAAFGAGFFMAVTVTPFDMIRTQLMNQKPGQEKLYNGFFDCVTKVVKNKVIFN